MEKLAEKRINSVFEAKRVVSFGYGRHSAAVNMAIDEALFLDSARTGRAFVRFYDFDRPSVILSAWDHPDSIIRRNLNGIGVSRRETGGDPIYLDDKGTFSYSITGRVTADSPFYDEIDMPKNFKSYVHGHLGRIIADSIKEVVPESDVVEVAAHNSVRINGMPIAGHAQLIKGKYSFMYQGVIAIDKWDADRIRSVLRICDADYEELARLPSIKGASKTGNMDLDWYKMQFMGAVLKTISKDNEVLKIGANDRVEIMASSEMLLREKYSNNTWVFNEDPTLKIRNRFCMCNYDS